MEELLPRPLRIETMDVNVKHTPVGGVGVSVDGTLVVDELRLQPWAPLSSWSFGFGASTSAKGPLATNDVLRADITVAVCSAFLVSGTKPGFI